MLIFLAYLYSYKMGFIVEYVCIFMNIVLYIVLFALFFPHSSLYLYNLVTMHASNLYIMNAHTLPGHWLSDRSSACFQHSIIVNSVLESIPMCIPLYLNMFLFF